MRNGEARPQRRSMAAIEDKEFLGITVMERMHDATPQIFARPRYAEPLAFEA